jgi:hypothetical protein
MVVEYYPPEEIDFAQRLEVCVLYEVPMQYLIIYEGGDGSECLFWTEDRDYADAFVSRWNEAIIEDENLQEDVDYKQTCINLSLKREDEMEAEITELKREIKALQREIQRNKKGGDDK